MGFLLTASAVGYGRTAPLWLWIMIAVILLAVVAALVFLVYLLLRKVLKSDVSRAIFLGAVLVSVAIVVGCWLISRAIPLL